MSWAEFVFMIDEKVNHKLPRPFFSRWFCDYNDSFYGPSWRNVKRNRKRTS